MSTRAVIAPIADGKPRPRWSVMIPTYNCARFLGETLRSVLAQAPAPEIMQIEVVDDGSQRDDPEAVVREIGQGRVGFFRQPQNVGHIRNFETCLQRSRGHLIHLLHGDDSVRPGFYDKLGTAFELDETIGAAFCRHIFADEGGHWQNISSLEQAKTGVLNNSLERLASEQRIMTPSIVVLREIYERLGGFDSRLICAEDWEMWVRIAARYPIWYETEPLAIYRMHADSNTGRHIATGAERRYTRIAIEVFKEHLPLAIADSATKSARRTYALATLESLAPLIQRRDWAALRTQANEAFCFDHSLPVILRFLRLMIKFIAKR